MIRRRRSQRGEIPFSFDSFLDVVANVVGIILRLILVAWVGAKSYKGPPLPPPPPMPPPLTALPEMEMSKATEPDPLSAEVLRERQELARAQAELLALLKQQQQAPEPVRKETQELDDLVARRHSLDAEVQAVKHTLPEKGQKEEATASLEELQARRHRLEEEIAELRKLPPLKRELRYRTPISAPVLSRELTFECQNGRVTPVDIGGLIDLVDVGWRDKRDALRTRWEVTDQTPRSGAFYMRYTVERRRDLANDVGGVGPSSRASFSYGPTLLEVIPVDPSRGETAAQALAPGSLFLKILSDADAETAVTFWVYPDSFALYRQLRDYLHDRDLVVAGRPLRGGSLIRISPDGTASRGQ
jgi:hypothetical protein